MSREAFWPSVNNRIVILLTVILMVFSRPMTAASLSGIRTTAIIVNQLDDKASKCGITEDALDAALRLPVSAAGILIRPRGWDHLLSVTVTALPTTTSGCAAYVEVEGGRELGRLDEFGKIAETIYGAVWDKGTILTGPTYEFGKRVADAAEQFAKQWVAQWLKDNPK